MKSEACQASDFLTSLSDFPESFFHLRLQPADLDRGFLVPGRVGFDVQDGSAFNFKTKK